MKTLTLPIGKAYRLALTSVFVLLTACSGMPEKQSGELPAKRSLASVDIKEGQKDNIDVYDPFEGFNRGMYRFNAGFDRYVFLPVVSVYETVLPTFAQQGVSNFFSNIFEVTNFTNSLLQLKPAATAETGARFLINSTIGVVGLFDVAEKLGIHQHEEDFGQTLGHYGVNNGPYLVLPILGPSNLRDTTGIVTDTVAFNALDLLELKEHAGGKIAFDLLYAIDKRHSTSFRYYDTGSPFEYELVRLLYTKKRDLDIAR